MDTGYIDNVTRLVKDDLVSAIQAGDRGVGCIIVVLHVRLSSTSGTA